MEGLDFRPVLLAWAEMQAEELGAKKCSRKGVGGMIRVLNRHISRDVTDIYGRDARRALLLLDGHCRLCGKCPRAELKSEAAE
jgi:hypothetical protein